MSNPLIGMMAKQAVGNMPQAQMMQKFAEFRRSMAGRDPQQMIDEMLRTGRWRGGWKCGAKGMRRSCAKAQRSRRCWSVSSSQLSGRETARSFAFGEG